MYKATDRIRVFTRTPSKTGLRHALTGCLIACMFIFILPAAPGNSSPVNEGLSRILASAIMQDHRDFIPVGPGDGLLNGQEAVSTTVTGVPWWRKPGVVVVYFVLLAGAIAVLRKYELSRLRLRSSIRFAQMETSKLIELDHLKSRFFANISHEFRTPLTLLKGPVDQMLEECTDPKRERTLKVMQASVNRLMQLINQLLDLSRLESGEYRVMARRGYLSALLKGLVMSFETLAGTKMIRLHLEEAPAIRDPAFTNHFFYDRDILEKILNNLLSNAIKFTPKGGQVTVKVCVRFDNENPDYLEITVSDTGIGIPGDKLPNIYDRFYQVDPSSRREQEGTGIGLAHVRELVRIHHGSIAVKSLPGTGTTFSVRLPVGRDHFSPGQVLENPYGPEKSVIRQESDREGGETAQPASAGKDGGADKDPGMTKTAGTEPGRYQYDKPLVLIVEDHQDVRHYIAECLEDDYLTSQASGAEEGLRLAVSRIPDLIISDVMMPRMDGYAFCERIKTDEKTSHIPVILLTALAGDKDRVNGLETGADDYITKPFNRQELKVRVKNLIDIRKALRLHFSETRLIRPGEVQITSRDRKFFDKALSIVEQNMANERFSVEELGRELGMSQSQLHRKFRALINQNPLHFIRSVRMHRAMELLRKDAGNISEVAFMTGYDDPGYFTRTFKSFFHTLPSEVQKKQKA